MSTSQASARQGRWSELLLGGAAAGVGAPLLLGGLHRVLRLGHGCSPASLGWAAGMVGALVAGGLARRRLTDARWAERPSPSPEEAGSRPEPPRPGGDEGEELTSDWRWEARRRRLAALERHAATLSETPGREVPRSVERGPRRGPSGREQPWHESLASTSG